MPDQTLLLLLNDVRRKTLELLTGVSDRQARWAPPGLDNTILWHAGHSYILLEWLTAQALGREPQSPDGWFEMFSWQSRPETVPPDRWPPLQDVVRQLQHQHERLGAVIAVLTDEQLDEPVAGRLGHTARSFIVHALHDEACHGGEIWLLLKLLAAGHGG